MMPRLPWTTSIRRFRCAAMICISHHMIWSMPSTHGIVFCCCCADTFWLDCSRATFSVAWWKPSRRIAADSGFCISPMSQKTATLWTRAKGVKYSVVVDDSVISFSSSYILFCVEGAKQSINHTGGRWAFDSSRSPFFELHPWSFLMSKSSIFLSRKTGNWHK